LLQSALLVYLVADKFDLEEQISFQQKRIRELEERLQIFKAIDDFQIGFNQEEATNWVMLSTRRARNTVMIRCSSWP